MALSLNIGKCTNLGNYRENNEDSIEVKSFPDSGLSVAVVADGMGGQAAGEIASKRAVEIIPRELRKTLTSGVNTEAANVVRAAAAALGYRTILWSLDPQDWRPGLDAGYVRDSVVDRAQNGDVILLHFERRSTVDALPSIIDGLRARGFDILGLESLPSDR